MSVGPEHERHSLTDTDPTAVVPADRGATLHEQMARFGGIRWGAAFFGWLTATGTALILTALAAAAGTAFGLVAAVSDGQVVSRTGTPADVRTADLVTVIVVLAILVIAYYCGGYVAGRMARFTGVRQGVAVWIWSVVIAVVVAVLAMVFGNQFNILATLNGFPRLPIDEGTLTPAGVITGVVALAAALVGAILGGLGGMRYHRRIDRAAGSLAGP